MKSSINTIEIFLTNFNNWSGVYNWKERLLW